MPWWILSMDGKGKPRLAGPYPSVIKAQQLIDNCYDGVQAEPVPLPTRSMVKATRLLKERRVEEKGFAEGTKRFTHNRERV